MFITRECYDAIGGFAAELPVFEDIEIIQRIRKRTKFTILVPVVITSGRRYEQRGAVWLQLLFGCMHLGYALGVKPVALHRFYRSWIAVGTTVPLPEERQPVVEVARYPLRNPN